MPEQIDLELRALGRELDFPQTPALSGAVAARLRAEPPRVRVRLPRRRLVLALAALVAVLAAALAVPPVRGAILDALGIGGVTIERVDELPPVSPPGELGLGPATSLGEARERAEFPVRLPDPAEWGRPDGVFLSEDVPGGIVSLVYGDEQRPRLLLSEFQGSLEPDLVKKAVTPETRIEFVTVRGTTGVWITGEPHAVTVFDRFGQTREDVFRLAANTLVWAEDGVTYRLEGDFDLATAQSIAESVR
jgi:hypothetical protein